MSDEELERSVDEVVAYMADLGDLRNLPAIPYLVDLMTTLTLFVSVSGACTADELLERVRTEHGIRFQPQSDTFH
ncbi:MAG: hypothetical protein GY813_09350 [Halieaceae bacterium]|nr:hypothetical protein [Halieaceae bacterium]